MELHLFERGSHGETAALQASARCAFSLTCAGFSACTGFGLAKRIGPVRAWTELCEAWLRQRGLCD